MVLFDKGTYDKLYKEVPMYKLITPSVISERLKVCVVCIFIICTLNVYFVLSISHFIISRFPGTRFTRKTGIEGVDGKE
jgi:hypothetical protein